MIDINNFYKLIIKNKFKQIEKILKNDKNILYYRGHNGQLPIHDACFYANKKIIDIFLKYDKDILNAINISERNGYQILASSNPKLLINYMKKFKPKDIHYFDKTDHTILMYYINYNKLDISFLKKLKKLGCSLKYPENDNSIELIISKKCENLDKLKKIFKFDVNKLNKYTNPISLSLIIGKKLDCLKKIIEDYKFDINLSGRYENTISYCILNNQLYLKYLLTLKKINYNYLNTYNNSFLGIILINNINNIELDTQKNFLNKLDDINTQNNNGDTIVHLIFKNKRWNDFKDILKNKKVNLEIKNKENKTPLSYVSKKIKNEVNDILKKKIKNCSLNINLLKNNKNIMHTKFESIVGFSDLFFLLFFIKKYNIGVPICVNEDKKDTSLKSTNNGFTSHVNYILTKNINCLLCSQVIFMDKDNYYINSNLKKCIKNVIDKKIIILNISKFYLNSSNHANILIIDNTKKIIERFETHGYIVSKNNTSIELDNLLKRKIIKIMNDLTGVKYKYFTPNDYQNLFDFQNLYDGYKNYQLETGGFCGAWIYWYLEHKILNPKIDSDELILKLKKSVLNSKYNIRDIIRGYSAKLEEFKNKKLIEYKIPKKKIYFIFNENELHKKIINKIYAELLEIQNIK